MVACENIGVQIAIELSANRAVYLTLGKRRKFLPLKFMTKNIFWWLNKLSVLEESIETKHGHDLEDKKDTIFFWVGSTIVESGKPREEN